MACYHGEADVARVLIEGGANVNKENEVCKLRHNVCYAGAFYFKTVMTESVKKLQLALKHCK